MTGYKYTVNVFGLAGDAHTEVQHDPVTLFHASFLPIWSKFSPTPPPPYTVPHFIPPFLLNSSLLPLRSQHSLTQSKIRKRSWVLHECVERVPENVDAAKELLQYGLKGTDLEALIAIGNKEDGGR